MEDIYAKLKEKGCGFMATHTANPQFLMDFIKELNPPLDTVLEIGTFNGLSTIVLAQVAQRVFTFDICVRNAEFTWNLYKIRNKISMFVGNNSQEIRDEIQGRMQQPEYLKTTGNKYNFAFIDGDHNIDAVKYDFETVKFTGRVLFHDTQKPPIGNFVKSIGGIIVHKHFGYWENKKINEEV